MAMNLTRSFVLLLVISSLTVNADSDSQVRLVEIGNDTVNDTRSLVKEEAEYTPTFAHCVSCPLEKCRSCDEFVKWFLLGSLALPVSKIIFCLLAVFLGFPLFVGFVLKELFMGICHQRRDLSGQVALVTGGSAGLGFEVAKELAESGATVVITSRNAKRGLDAATDLRNITGNTFVTHQVLDLSSLQSVRKMAVDFQRKNKVLDILVNNGGNFASGRVYTGINDCSFFHKSYVGHFLLTNLLVSALNQSKCPVVVTVTCPYQLYGSLARLQLDGSLYQQFIYFKFSKRFQDYMASKLAYCCFSQEIAKRCPRFSSFSANPGIFRTRYTFPHYQDLRWYCPRRFRDEVCLYLEFLVMGCWGKSTKQSAQTVLTCIMKDNLENGANYSNCRRVSFWLNF